jgi:outer membrane protease
MAFFTVLFIIILILSAINPIFCQDNGQIGKYNFSLGTGFGIIYGQSLELVYSVSGETKNELLSELIWDMKPVAYAGLDAKFELADFMSSPGFFTSLSFKAGIPGESGVMEDRDWLYPSNSELTRFSSHTNKTDRLFWLDAAVGVSFPIMSFIYIKPFISGSWMHFAFTGMNGDGIYKDWNPQEQYFPRTKVISYRQDWLLAAAGLSIGTKILYPFLFELSFQISPFTYCAAEDNHLMSDTIFRDFTTWGLFLEPSGKVSYEYKKLNFSLEFLYRFIGNTKGDLYLNEGNTNFYLASNKAGAGLSVMDIQFVLKFII